MFNKKLKQYSEELQKILFRKDAEILSLNNKIRTQEKEIKRLEEFDKIIFDKIKEIGEPKLNSWFIANGGNFLEMSGQLQCQIDDYKQKYTELLLHLCNLEKQTQETQKVFVLADKLERLIKKLEK